MKHWFGNTQRGFTLVETMFVALLFPLLFLSMYSVMDMSRVIFNTNSVYSQLNHNAMQSLRSISREIGQSSPLQTPSHLTIAQNATGNSMVTFQIPVDWDGDGDAHTGTLNPQTEWGAYSRAGETANGQLGAWTQYYVVNNPVTNTNQLVREVLNAAMVPIAGTQQIVVNNVNTFTIVRNQNILRMTLVLTGTSQIGQAGGQRVYTTTFTSESSLRNAVN